MHWIIVSEVLEFEISVKVDSNSAEMSRYQYYKYLCKVGPLCMKVQVMPNIQYRNIYNCKTLSFTI